MSERRTRLQSTVLVAVMVLSVLLASTAFAGGALAAVSGGTIQTTQPVQPGEQTTIEVDTSGTTANADVIIGIDVDGNGEIQSSEVAKVATSTQSASQQIDFTPSDATDVGPSSDGSFTVAVIEDTSGSPSDGTDDMSTYQTSNAGATPNLEIDGVAPTINSGATTLDSANGYVDVTFSEGTYTDTASGALTASDFTYSFNQNSGQATDISIDSVTKTDGSALTGGETTVRVQISVTDAPASGVETVEIQPASTSSIYDDAGNPMADTESTGTVTLNDQNPPAAPGGVSATNVSGGDIDVSFDDVDETGSGVTSYSVKRSTSSGGPYSEVGTVTDDDSASYTYTDTTTSDDTTYYYVVTAIDNDANEGSQSTEASATSDATSPTATIDSITPTPITDTETGNGNEATVTVTFDENMDQTPSDVTVTPDVNTELTSSVTVENKQWTGPQTFTADLQFADDNEAVSGVDLEVTGAKDLAGNSMGTQSTTYDVDTENPTINSGATTLDEANAHVNVTFSEGAYTSTASGALTASDFSYSFSQNSGQATDISIDSVTKTDGTALAGGETTVQVQISVTNGPASGVETVEIQPASASSIYDDAGNPMADSESSGTVTLNDQNPPSAPGGVSATNVSGGDIDVSFDDVDETGSGVTTYSVKRSTTSGSGYSEVTTVTDDDSTSYTYTDTGVSDDTTYYYVVTAIDADGNEGSQSSEASATSDATPPTATIDSITPTPITDTETGDGNEATVTVSFDEQMDQTPSDVTVTPDLNTELTSPVTVENKQWTDAQTFTADLQFTDDNETVSGVDLEVTGAKDLAGNSMGTQSTTYDVDTENPTINSGATTLDGANGHVNVTFSEGVYTDTGSGALTASDFSYSFTQNSGQATDISIDSVTKTDGTALAGGETTVQVQISVTNGPASGVETVEIQPASASSIYDDSGNPMADSESSGTETLNDQNPPAAPSGVSATNVSGGDIDISFDDVNETGSGVTTYSVKRSTSSGGPYSEVGTVTDDDSTSYTHTDTGASDGTTYYYVVTAIDSDSNEGSQSSEASATSDATSPTATIDSITPTPITDSETGDGNEATVTVTFDEQMNQTASDVTVTPDLNTELTSPVTVENKQWTDAQTFTADLQFTDDNETVSGVDLEVTGAKDLAGNTMSAQSTTYDVDTAVETASITAQNPSGQNISVEVSVDEKLNDLTVSDDGGNTVSGIGTNFTETQSGSTYTYNATYNTSADGDYTVTLDSLTDANRNVNTTTGVGTTVSIDTNIPSATVAVPTDDVIVASQDTIAGNSSDNSQVTAVNLTIQRDSDGDYWNDTGWQDTETTVSASASDGSFDTGDENWTYDSSGINSGDSYTVTATAKDDSDNTADSSAVTYTIDTEAPSVSITDPADGDRIQSQNTITGSASDDTEVRSVNLTIQRNSDNYYWNDSGWQAAETNVSATADSGQFNTSAESWSYDSSAISADGDYNVTANVTDALNNTNSSATANYTLYTSTSNPPSGGGGGGGGSTTAADDADSTDIENVVKQVRETQPDSESETEIEDSDGDSSNGVTVDTSTTSETVDAITFDDAETSGTVTVREYSEPPQVVTDSITETVSGQTVSDEEADADDGETDTADDGESTDSGSSQTVNVVSVADISTGSGLAIDEQERDRSVTVTMRVARDRLTNPANAVVFHETDDGWEQLETTVEERDDGMVRLEAQTDSFSLFAVAEIQDSSQMDAETDADDTGNETATETDDAADEPTDDTVDETPGFGAVLAAVALIATALLARRQQ